ncbi:MAG: thermonuclease family protein [Robiginitomaculum sp.]|nr:thermonuclease family protein [Robiginitomaculum sp.]
MLLTRRHIWLGLGATGLTSAFCKPVFAQENLSKNFLQNGKAQHIISGDSFILEDGRRIRLTGMDAPRMAIGDAVAQPLSATAKQLLHDLIAGQELSFVAASPDRFGRVRAHVLIGRDQKWLQGEMLERGMGRVRIWSDDDNRITKMLAIEEQARHQKTGIWARGFYAIRTPQTITSARGSFQIVEGEIVDAASTRKMNYLNFGADWRTDFTAQATKKIARKFSKAGINLSGLSGARVRVRGLIKSSNGPSLWLNHVSQLQILDNE